MTVRKAFLALFVSAPLFLFAGCQETNQQSDRTKVARWERLADGSMGRSTIRPSVNGSVPSSEVERCWLVNSRQDCLSVHTIGDALFAYRYVKESLNGAGPRTSAIDGFRGGYSCSAIQLLITEIVIAANSEPLLMNRVLLDAGDNIPNGIIGQRRQVNGTPWGRSFVEKYLADNINKPDILYVECSEIARLINQGSSMTLNTTSLTYDGMRGVIGDEGMESAPELDESLGELEGLLQQEMPTLEAE